MDFSALEDIESVLSSYPTNNPPDESEEEQDSDEELNQSLNVQEQSLTETSPPPCPDIEASKPLDSTKTLPRKRKAVEKKANHRPSPPKKLKVNEYSGPYGEKYGIQSFSLKLFRLSCINRCYRLF